MKNLTNTTLIAYVISMSLFAMSAQARLQVVTKPFGQSQSAPSLYKPIQNFSLVGLLIKTVNERNICWLDPQFLQANNMSALDFSNHLQKLHSAPETYVLTCLTKEKNDGNQTSPIIGDITIERQP